MFGLFKKKSAERPEEQDRLRKAADQSARKGETPEAVRALGQQFLPQELSILAVTGPAGFSGQKLEDSDLWLASIGLTAWMEEDSPDIRREEIQLVTLADEKLLGFLRQRTYPDFLIKCRVRPSQDGQRLLLLDLPQPGFDPDLKAILEEQKKPDSTYVEGLGTFVLNRRIKWYETEVDWLGGKVRLNFDQGPEEEMKAAQETARALLADPAGWDARVRACAADRLLELANQWAGEEEDGENEPGEIDREQFMSRMELDTIQVSPDQGFVFWFNDGEMFWGHSIQVSGTLSDGPVDAQMEG